MSDLFEIRLESDLSEFDSTVTDGGDLSQSAAAALAGTNGGLSCLVDDTTAIYGQKNQTAPVSGEFRIRVYADFNTLSMANGDNFEIVRFQLSGDPWSAGAIRFRLSGESYQIGGAAWGDAGAAHTQYSTVDETAEHYVEVHVIRATNDASSDGEYRWWIDGVEEDHWQDLDNYDSFALLSSFKFGAPSSLDVGTSGTFYLDEFKANDDGSEIGPHTSGRTTYNTDSLPLGLHVAMGWRINKP